MSQHFVLLLEQPVTFTRIPQLGGLLRGGSRSPSGLDLSLAQLVLQAVIGAPEILDDPLDRHPRLTALGDSQAFVADRSWIGLGHVDILPAAPRGFTAQMSPTHAPDP